MNEQRGCKVVRYKKGKYYSLFEAGPQNTVEYTINEWAARPVGGGPLCVFRYYENAFYFWVGNCEKRGFGDCRIFTCYYRPSEDGVPWVTIDNEHLRIGPPRAAFGTHWADAVKLNEDITP